MKPMKLYYVAYNYGHQQYEMLDGPFGRWIEANDARLLHDDGDPNLVIVSEIIQVEEV